MSFFSRSNSDEQQSFINLMVAAGNSDGDFSDDEIDNYVALFVGRSLFKSLDAQPLIRKAMLGFHAADSKDQFISQSANQISAEWAPTVFASCADIIFRDKFIADGERDFLKNLSEKLKVDAGTVEKILDVFTILYKGFI